MEVYIIPMLADNLCYYITRDLATKPGILIDVAEPVKLKKFMQANGITMPPTLLLTTHKHSDHSAGNRDVAKSFPGIHIIGGADDRIPAMTQACQHNQQFEVNDIRITCLHTPCHTRGSFTFVFEP